MTGFFTYSNHSLWVGGSDFDFGLMYSSLPNHALVIVPRPNGFRNTKCVFSIITRFFNVFGQNDNIHVFFYVLFAKTYKNYRHFADFQIKFTDIFEISTNLATPLKIFCRYLTKKQHSRPKQF